MYIVIEISCTFLKLIFEVNY